MLLSLTIKNIVLIDHLVIAFENGFCALTGETGAGKSILLDSLGLALGYRAEAGLVRKGEDQAVVIAEFSSIAQDHPIHSYLNEQAVESDMTLLLKRSLGADGRSRAFINDQPVSVGTLRAAGGMLVEIHGQFETHGLLDQKTHRKMLDDYAGVDPAALPEAWRVMQDARQALDDMQEAIAQARAEEDYLRQSLEDIDTLDPKEGEEDSLSELRDRLMNKEKYVRALDGAHQALTEEGGVESGLHAAWRMLEQISAQAGEEMSAVTGALDRAGAEIQEAVQAIQSASAAFDESDYNLQEIDDRLFALRGQARKHQCEIDDLPRIRDELADRLSAIEQQDERLDILVKALDKAKAAYLDVARKTSQQRRKTAEKLDGFITAELPPLKLDKARFVTHIDGDEAEENWTVHGFDKVAFLVSTNPGREPDSLQKIASGGEMSRFMLALKVVMADVGMAPTLIFDEVDSGIGGSTAAAVGERLKRLAKERQILVVTHAPQVAALANGHYIVQKAGNDDVKTSVVILEDHSKRREEIARMISGSTITEEARAAADKLLEKTA